MSEAFDCAKKPAYPDRDLVLRAQVHQSLHFVPVTIGRPDLIAIHNAFNADELDLIDGLCSTIPLERKFIGPSGEIKHAQLDAQVGGLANSDETAWLFIKLEQHLQAANSHLRVALWGIAEALQYTTYQDGRYCWHVDNAFPEDGLPRPSRKLSFELMLSPPSDYAGGAREHMGKEKVSARHERGTLIVFPSYLLTRVYSVTHGTRRSLEGWVCGDEFR